MFYLSILDYPKILNRISAYATLNETKKRIESLEPLIEKETIFDLLRKCECAKNVIYRIGPLELYPFDMELTIDRIRISAFLSINELLEIVKLIMDSNKISSYFKQNSSLVLETGDLNEYIDSIVSLRDVRDMIGSVIDEEGYVLDNASIDLYKIRKRIRELENEANQKLSQILKEQSQKLSETIISIRNGHRVIPVKSEYRNQIKGIVFDESSSGQTVYIEPYAVSDISNKVTILKNEETNEIERILNDLSIKISAYYEPIKKDLDIVREMDFIFSKAMYAKETESIMPEMGDNVNLINARHPLIDKNKIVPNTIYFEEGKKTMIITGPNTGGKTVVLKTLGLLSLMAQSGILIPCKEGSSIRIFDGIYADIGDEQSIEQSLSTFSSHMSRISSIVKDAKKDSLCLFDELGSGTDPKEGASLAISILNHLRKSSIYSITTTHYPELKIYAYENSDIENASVEFDNDTLKPTYKLLIGISGGSNAFLISKRLGLMESIIEDAEMISNGFKSGESDLIKRIEEDRIKAEKLRVENENLKLQLEKDSVSQKNYFKKEREKLNRRLDEVEKERNEILSKAQDEASRLLEEIKEIKKDIKKDKDVKENVLIDLRGRTNSLIPESRIRKNHSKKTLQVGDSVRIIEYNQIGSIVTIKNDRYEVQFGNFKKKFKKEEIEYVEVEKERESIISSYRKPKESLLKANVKSTLDLRGYRYEEAEAELDKFIDDCLMCNLETVQIIHGFGTLAIRNMVIQYCRTHKEIKSYRPGDEHEGGRGVTVISLK